VLLLTLRYYALALDLRGHGDSQWAPNGNYAYEDFANDIDAIVRVLTKPPVLVGGSLGGIASLIVAARMCLSLAS